MVYGQAHKTSQNLGVAQATPNKLQCLACNGGSALCCGLINFQDFSKTNSPSSEKAIDVISYI